MFFVEFKNLIISYLEQEYDQIVFSDNDIVIISPNMYFVLWKDEIVRYQEQEDVLYLKFKPNLLG